MEFYKYTNLGLENGGFWGEGAEKRLKTLATHAWFSNPLDLNDPFDCGFHFLVDGILRACGEEKSLASVRARARLDQSENTISRKLLNAGFDVVDGKIRKKIENWEDRLALQQYLRTLKNIVSNLGVFCLAQEPENKLLWSHYADQHRGACLVYTVSESHQKTYQSLTHGKLSPLGALSVGLVEYLETPADRLQNIFGEHGENILEMNELALSTMILTKDNPWRYEREFRVLSEQYGPQPLDQLGLKLKKIVLGGLMPLETKARIKRETGSSGKLPPGIELSEVILEKFDLQEVPLDQAS